MNLKKTVLVFLAVILVMVLVISGCSSPAPSPSPSPTATATPKPSATPTATAYPTATASPKPTTSVAPIKLKFATYHASSYWAWEPCYQAFKKDVEAKSGGRLLVDIYPSGQLAPQAALFDAVRTGTADIAWVSDNGYPEALPVTQVWNLPPIWTNSAIPSVWAYNLNNEFFKAEHEKSNMHQIGFWVGPPYWMYTLKKAANKIEDLKGLTLRTFSQETTEMFSIFGIVPVNVPFSDVFDLMNKGTMDGATGLLASVESYKWQTIGKPGYFIDMGGLPSFSSSVEVNKNTYDKLPADLQKILDQAGYDFFVVALGKGNDQVELGAMDRMTKGSTATAIHWTDVEKLRVSTALAPMWDKWAKAKDTAGLPGTKVVNAIKALAAKK